MKVAIFKEKDIRKAYDKGFKDGISFSSENITKFSQLVLIDKFGFEKEEAERFATEFNYLCDSCVRDYIDSDDIIEAVNEVLNNDYIEDQENEDLNSVQDE